MRLFVFRIYPIVVSGRLHLDIGDIVVGHFLLDGDDRLINQYGRQMVVIVCDNISAGRRVVPLEVGGPARNDLFQRRASISRNPRA